MERPGYDPFPQRDHRAHRGSLGCERACYTVRKVNNWWAPVPEHRGALDLRFANDVWLHQLSLEISETLGLRVLSRNDAQSVGGADAGCRLDRPSPATVTSRSGKVNHRCPVESYASPHVVQGDTKSPTAAPLDQMIRSNPLGGLEPHSADLDRASGGILRQVSARVKPVACNWAIRPSPTKLPIRSSKRVLPRAVPGLRTPMGTINNSLGSTCHETSLFGEMHQTRQYASVRSAPLVVTARNSSRPNGSTTCSIRRPEPAPITRSRPRSLPPARRLPTRCRRRST